MNLPTLTISAGKGWMDQRERFSGNIAGKEQKNYTLLSKNELSYNKGNSKLAKYGVVFKLQEFNEALVPKVYHSFRTTSESYPDFIEYVFATKKPERELAKLITSGARMDGLLNIKFDDFMSIKINMTNKDEQIKIASYLKSIDNIITLHQRKINILETLKKVYLNVMFPNRSEDIPRLHFKFFNEVWEQRKVEDIAIVNTGKKDTQDAVTDGAYDFYIRSPKIEKINSYSYNGEAVLTVGDGVGVGKVFHYVNGKFDYHQRVYKISDFKNYNGLFFYYYFSNNFKYEARKYNAKTSVDSVRREMITKMNFPYTSLNEQVKVGQFFKEIDNIITLHQRKLHRLSKIKYVYLNKLFI